MDPMILGRDTWKRSRGWASRLRPALACTAALAFSACLEEVPRPPDTRVAVVVDTFHGVPVPDPYRWLEDQESAETREWIRAQNAHARAVVSDTVMLERLARRLRELMGPPSPIFARSAGGRQYFSARLGNRPAGAIYRRAEGAPAEAPVDPQANHEIIVDPLDWAADGTSSVAILDLSPNLLLYSLRRGGADEVEVRVRDLSTKEDLEDRLEPALYGRVRFSAEGDAIEYVRRSREDGPRFRRRMLFGGAPKDSVLFGEGLPPESFLSVAVSGEPAPVFRAYVAQHGWARADVYLERVGQEGPPLALATGENARFEARFVGDELFLLTNLGAPNNRILAVDPENPGPPESWREALPESRQKLMDYTVGGGYIYAHYLADVSSRIVRFRLDGEPAGEMEIPEHHAARFSLAEGAGRLRLASLIRPESIYEVDLETLEMAEELPSRVPFDGSPFTVRQTWYESADGTRGPMYLAHRRDVVPDGDAPTLLYGYGGFNVSVLPRFDPRAAVWMESGGVYAVATLRGGGEYGEEWHRAGMLENKPNVVQDFIAATEWLIDHGVARPRTLAIRGVSNGGLLVASAMVRRPDLYRAVFSGFPDLDMIRFHEFTQTNNKPALLEYGDSRNPAHFRVHLELSPYQNVQNGARYPAVFLAQGEMDTRVPPLQARKMAARLQAATSSGLPVILDHDPRAGHAGGRSFEGRVQSIAMELAFLMDQVGLRPPGSN